MFLLVSSCVISGFFLFYGKSIKNKINDFQALYHAQNQYEKNSIKCFRDTIQTILKVYMYKLFNQVENPVQKYDDKNIVLTYVHMDEFYKILIRTHKGPPLIEKITNENNVDFSKEVRQYLGPNNDFHQRKFKPSFWNQNELNFHYNNSSEIRTFKFDEFISLF